MLKFIFWAVVALLTITWICKVTERGNVESIKISQYDFKVPSDFVLDRSVPEWLRWLPGGDEQNNGFLFLLPASVIKKSIDGYAEFDERYTEDIRGHVVVLNKEERKKYTDGRQYIDLWRRQGEYESSIVENADGLYKVYRKVEYPYSWALVTAEPGTASNLPDNLWIAHCLRVNSNLNLKKEHSNCRSHVIKDDLLIEFNISEQNMKKIDEVKSYLIDQILEWKVNQ